MPDIFIHKINELEVRVQAERSILQELSDLFTFRVPNAHFIPAVRNKFWDGNIRLLNASTGKVYYGLIAEIYKHAKLRGYSFDIDPAIAVPNDYPPADDNFIEHCDLTVTPRDYQIETLQHAVAETRAVFVSPTASGKSLSIFLITQYHNALKRKTLIIVPTVSLVLQMKTDFESYTNQRVNIHCISAGVDRESEEPIVISTWQSIYKMPKQWFDQFDCVIGDEVHQFKATSLKSIMEKLTNCPYRYGFTGTLDGSLTNELTLVGLFGPVYKVTTTTQLQQQKMLAKLKIKCIIMGHPTNERKNPAHKQSYHDEINYLVNNSQRNKYIRNLALSLDGNTLILHQLVDRHGQVLFDLINAKADNRPVFFVHGGVDGQVREEIRAEIEQQTNAIIVASYGTFSTGVNIRNLHNVIFASPSKSRVRVLQSIGRVLRMSDTKQSAVLFDIADDLTHGRKQNFTLRHFAERLEIYNQEQFDYKIYKVDL